MPKRTWNILLIIGFSVYLLFSLLTIHKYGNVYQWDFKKDYYAAKVQAAGLDFYDAPYLRHMAGSQVDQYYIYTPPSIWFFRLFALFSFKIAYTLVLVLKILILVGLVWLWKKEFRLGPLNPGFFIFLFFAFHYALMTDILAGNVALFELAGLWVAFFLFLRRRYILFSLIVVLISLFKIMPLFFLVLLLFSKARRRLLLATAAGMSFLLIQGFSYLLNPSLYRSFVTALSGSGTFEWGGQNLSLLSLLKAGLGMTGWTSASVLAMVLYLAAIAAISIITFRTYLQRRISWGEDSERILILLACLVFCLICPRMKDYSYIIVLLPGYIALRTLSRDKGYAFLFLLLVLDTPDSIAALSFRSIADLFWTYYPLILAMAIWLLFVGRSHAREKTESNMFPFSSVERQRRSTFLE